MQLIKTLATLLAGRSVFPVQATALHNRIIRALEQFVG
ncbi:hypothetical protein ABIE73_005577 [Bradyrhizobium yuanmingense]